MIEIDGSYGEGGGQILRTSVSLSALTLKPVTITKIRAGRPKPGLKRQHIAGIELTSQIVGAEVDGLEIGSTKVTFRPSELMSGNFSYDIGTAGSISLVLQAVLPPAILSADSVKLSLRGGTDVNWSPPIDYLREVFIPIIQRMGANLDIKQIKRGHYPRGGGQVEVIVTPTHEITPVNFLNFGDVARISGISHCVRLPSHVADRQANAVESELARRNLTFERLEREWYQKNNDPHLGAGSGVVLWAESTSGIRIGADRLGERGKRAEEVGKEAVMQLLQELATGKAIDSHLCDMLIPYLALANGPSQIGVTEITSHLITNIWVAERILGVNITLEGNLGEPGTVSIEGIGFSSSK
ncbi:MAG: RNA 3'-terminal phosphate cyclase [Candidatus Thorarchaeota archaeon]|jgi:RNA 3'-phosphate cyclase